MTSRRQLTLFLAAVLLMAGAMAVHEAIFNNFLRDTFDIPDSVLNNVE